MFIMECLFCPYQLISIKTGMDKMNISPLLSVGQFFFCSVISLRHIHIREICNNNNNDKSFDSFLVCVRACFKRESLGN